MPVTVNRKLLIQIISIHNLKTVNKSLLCPKKYMAAGNVSGIKSARVIKFSLTKKKPIILKVLIIKRKIYANKY